MTTYTYSDERATQLMQKQGVARLPFQILIIGIGFFIANSTTKGQIFKDGVVLGISMILVSIVLYIGFRYSMKTGKRILMQNKYTLTNKGLERQTPAGETIKIDFNNVTEHTVLRYGLLLKTANEQIVIPANLDQYEELSNLVLAKLK